MVRENGKRGHMATKDTVLSSAHVDVFCDNRSITRKKSIRNS